MALNMISVAVLMVLGSASAASKAGFIKVPLERKSDLSAYMLKVQVGTPPQTESWKIDTGSPTYSFLDPQNAWCQESTQPCKEYGTFDNETSKTSRYAGSGFSDELIDYGSGDFLRDQVIIGSKVLSSAYFGYISFYPFFDHLQIPTSTIAGVSLVYNKQGGNYTNPGPWLLPQLKAAGLIDKMSVSFYLGPDLPNGTHPTMILGSAYDQAKFAGKPFVVPMVDPYDQNLANGQTNSVNVTQIESVIHGNVTSQHYGDKSLGAPVLMDTGNPTWSIPQPIFGQVFKWLGSPQTQDQSNGVYIVDCSLLDRKAEDAVIVHFGNLGQIRIPLRRLITRFADGTCGSFIGNGGDSLEQGFGDPFLRSAYTIFDQEDLTITFAQVKYTDKENVVTGAPAHYSS